MELRQLRYFVAVAEELHFTRAAARLNLAQSALSSQIRHLEAEVGGPLFVRSTRRVRLTPGGEALLTDVREQLAALDVTLDRVRALCRGEAGRLTIGTLGPAPGNLLAALLGRMGSRRPDVRVEVRAFDFTDVFDGLLHGLADLAFVYLPLKHPDIEFVPLLREPRVVVLAADHPLARRASLRPRDLAAETFITQPHEVQEPWRDFWALTDELGARPRLSPHHGDKLEDWLLLIAHGEGIDTAPAVVTRYYAWPEIAFVPLVDAAPATLALARRRDVEHPLADEVVALVLDIVRHVDVTGATVVAPPAAGRPRVAAGGPGAPRDAPTRARRSSP
ncbi:LysR substrate-binding domain-containing protein [Patulibacter americanus]|uniref:LysR substrate-binding domain-containing protein n=1 Tax=Patulibacter americanus TaxID=588672 RepID=UPI0003B5A5E5|nr:LysR substrate-binding domain-containing protein [Patulibacter americanus]